MRRRGNQKSSCARYDTCRRRSEPFDVFDNNFIWYNRIKPYTDINSYLITQFFVHLVDTPSNGRKRSLSPFGRLVHRFLSPSAAHQFTEKIDLRRLWTCWERKITCQYDRIDEIRMGGVRGREAFRWNECGSKNDGKRQDTVAEVVADIQIAESVVAGKRGNTVKADWRRMAVARA